MNFKKRFNHQQNRFQFCNYTGNIQTSEQSRSSHPPLTNKCHLFAWSLMKGSTLLLCLYVNCEVSITIQCWLPNNHGIRRVRGSTHGEQQTAATNGLHRHWG